MYLRYLIFCEDYFLWTWPIKMTRFVTSFLQIWAKPGRNFTWVFYRHVFSRGEAWQEGRGHQLVLYSYTKQNFGFDGRRNCAPRASGTVSASVWTCCKRHNVQQPSTNLKNALCQASERLSVCKLAKCYIINGFTQEAQIWPACWKSVISSCQCETNTRGIQSTHKNHRAAIKNASPR